MVQRHSPVTCSLASEIDPGILLSSLKKFSKVKILQIITISFAGNFQARLHIWLVTNTCALKERFGEELPESSFTHVFCVTCYHFTAACSTDCCALLSFSLYGSSFGYAKKKVMNCGGESPGLHGKAPALHSKGPRLNPWCLPFKGSDSRGYARRPQTLESSCQ